MSHKCGGVYLSPYCSNACVFCRYEGSKRASKLELKKDEINTFKNLVDFRVRGISEVEITGCDPIEYDKIVPLIKYMKKIGFKLVQLSTHGKRLSDESFLNELISSGLDMLRIPLYSSTAKIHDSVTQTKGSFDATLKGIKQLLKKSSNIQVQISCLILQQNKNNLIDLVDLVNKLKIKDFYFAIPCVSHGGYSFYVPTKDLGPYVKKIYSYASRINYKIKFMEIPYCVFGKIDESINNTCLPPDLGKYCQPSKEQRSKIKDLPSYRIKKKIDMCNNCKASNFCDGFFVNDIDKFGTGELKPIIR